MPQPSMTYMKPSSTNGVASSDSLAPEPPRAMANSSFKFLIFDLLMASSGEWRCAPKSRWFISQLCGSGLSRRSKVTSVATSGDVPAKRTQPSAATMLANFFIVASPGSQPEHEQHGRVLRHRLRLGRIGESTDLVTRQAGGNGNILLAIDLIGDRRCVDAGPDIDRPQLFERLLVERHDGAVQ